MSKHCLFKAFQSVTQICKCSPIFMDFPSLNIQVTTELVPIPWPGNPSLPVRWPEGHWNLAGLLASVTLSVILAWWMDTGPFLTCYRHPQTRLWWYQNITGKIGTQKVNFETGSRHCSWLQTLVAPGSSPSPGSVSPTASWPAATFQGRGYLPQTSSFPKSKSSHSWSNGQMQIFLPRAHDVPSFVSRDGWQKVYLALVPHQSLTLYTKFPQSLV